MLTKEGTKTNNPTDLESAQRVFDSIVVAKTNKGYRVEGDDTISESQPGEGGEFPVDASVPAADLSAYLTGQLSNESDSGKRARLLWRLGDLAQTADVSKLKQRDKAYI